jgi:iron(III) transport system substrate-binding protein
MHLSRALPYVLVAALSASGCGVLGASGGPSLTVYSGRSEQLVGPLLQRFERESGIDLEIRYAGTPELANAILEEGDNSPADVFFAQDAGSLGALAERERLGPLPERLLSRVPQRFRSPEDLWVGVSGRARVVAYNPTRVPEPELPDSVLAFTDPKWKGRVGWAPTNGSFQSFLTALRLLRGEAAARAWLEGMVANHAAAYPNNISIVEAVGKGEIDVGLANHYYLFELKEQDPSLAAANHFLAGGDPGALVNAAGVGILDSTNKREESERLVEFLLSDEAQRYFATETFEYPLVDGVEPVEGLQPLSGLQPPDIDLSDLSDLRGTQELLTETGVL